MTDREKGRGRWYVRVRWNNGDTDTEYFTSAVVRNAYYNKARFIVTTGEVTIGDKKKDKKNKRGS